VNRPPEFHFNDFLQAELDRIRASGLWRRLRIVDSPQGPTINLDGHELINFSSNDYLGLCNHPKIKEAAVKTIEKFGFGAGASRLISGHSRVIDQLESNLAAFKQTEAALVFPSGYSAMLGIVCSVFSPGDVLILDRLAHACMIDAARLSGATIRVFAHNDVDDLEEKLRWATSRTRGGTRHKVGILTESVFSMDGDLAPLKEIVELKEKYGAILVLDEAHATGVLGPDGRGLAHQLRIASRVEIQMGTLSKAFGALGGFVCGTRPLIEFLVNRARSFIFTTGLPPAIAAAALAALEIAQSEEGNKLRATLRTNVSTLCEMVNRPIMPAAIVPIIVGNEERATLLSNHLLQRGFYVPAIRFPAVKHGSARLRVSISAAHTPDQICRLALALKEINL